MSSPKIWRQRFERYRMTALKCKACAKVCFPSRMVCPACGSRDFEEVAMPETGKIATYTTVHVGPKFLEHATPYVLGIVEFENGVRVTTQIADADPKDVKIGKEVRMVFRKLKAEGKTGVIMYGYKAQLV
jgi:uncharacterized OB-fold protein